MSRSKHRDITMTGTSDLPDLVGHPDITLIWNFPSGRLAVFWLGWPHDHEYHQAIRIVYYARDQHAKPINFEARGDAELRRVIGGYVRKFDY